MGHTRGDEFANAIDASSAVAVSAYGLRVCVVGRSSFAGLCQGIEGYGRSVVVPWFVCCRGGTIAGMSVFDRWQAVEGISV